MIGKGDMNETWPLWQIVKAKSVGDLVNLQWSLYGTKLDLTTKPPQQLVSVIGDVEELEEIDKLIKEKPVYGGKGWQGG